MKRLIVYVVTCLALCSLFACTAPKNRAINRLEKLSKELYLHQEDYTAEDYQVVRAEMENIKVELDKYKAEYTTDELSYIRKLETECRTLLIKNGDNKWDDFNDWLNDLWDKINE
ncbi:MAG: hypothetical protein ACI3Z5_05135 [Paludibacteraceae bacterium]